jgi:hypothetical protein
MKCVVLYAAFAVALAIGGCSAQETELARVASPDGQTVALLDGKSGGGAAGASVVYLYLVEAKDMRDHGEPVLVATDCQGLSLTWLTQSTLRINYYPTCWIKRFTNRWYSKTALRSVATVIPPVELLLMKKRMPSD